MGRSVYAEMSEESEAAAEGGGVCSVLSEAEADYCESGEWDTRRRGRSAFIIRGL